MEQEMFEVMGFYRQKGGRHALHGWRSGTVNRRYMIILDKDGLCYLMHQDSDLPKAVIECEPMEALEMWVFKGHLPA